ncbi:MAG: slipin family protein, partial [Trebonia sp.]
MVAAIVVIVIVIVLLAVIAAGRSMRVIQQYEKGIIYRFGKVLPEVQGPGLKWIRPIGDRMQKV